jgi:uncharacterized membrane protein YhaH (DUF805 family)
MNDPTKSRRSVAGLLYLIVALATPVAAQQPAEDTASTPDPLGVSVERAKNDIAAFFRLEAQLAEVEPGFRRLLRSRLDERERMIFKQIDGLADDLIDAERHGMPVDDEHRSLLIQWLGALTERANDFLARNRQAIVELLEEQSLADPTAAAQAVVDLDRAIERTVAVNRNLYVMLSKLEVLGVDVSKGRQELAARVLESAETLAVAIQLDADELAKLRVVLSLRPDDADLQALIKVADLRRKSYAENLNSVSRLLEDLGISSSDYRRLVLVVTGDVASQILDTGVMSGLAKEWSITALAWVNDNGLGWAIKLTFFSLILLAFRALSKLTRRWADRGLSNVNLSVLLRHMIASTAANLIMFIGIMIALSQLGISLGPLLARPRRPRFHHRLCPSGHAG